MILFRISIQNFKNRDTLQIRLHLLFSLEAAISRQDSPGIALTSPTHMTAHQALWAVTTAMEPYPPGHNHSAQDTGFSFPWAFAMVAHHVIKTDGEDDWVAR